MNCTEKKFSQFTWGLVLKFNEHSVICIFTPDRDILQPVKSRYVYTIALTQNCWLNVLFNFIQEWVNCLVKVEKAYIFWYFLWFQLLISTLVSVLTKNWAQHFYRQLAIDYAQELFACRLARRHVRYYNWPDAEWLLLHLHELVQVGFIVVLR